MINKLSILIALAALLMLAVLLPGCASAASAINGSGKIIDREIDIADFDSIQAGGDINLEIVTSNSSRVTISTDANLINRVLFTRKDKTLIIKIEAPASFFPTSLKIVIAAPQIISLDLSDGAKASIRINKAVPGFNLVLAKASFVDGYLETDSSNFYLSGGSRMNLQGKSGILELDAAGGSALDLSNFLISDANIKLREASTAALNVTGDLNIVLTDASKVYYLGNPLIQNTSITGDSSMIHQ